MSEFKFQLTTFALVAVLALGGYWAFATLDRGITYSKDDLAIVPETVAEESLEEPAAETEQETEVAEESAEVESPETAPAPATLSAEDAKTLAELQDLITDNINMKQGSAGTRVGTVQKFLNLYFDKQTGVDNGYGATTLERVRQFQKDQGLTADGLAGPTTYQKMVDLMKNGM